MSMRRRICLFGGVLLLLTAACSREKEHTAYGYIEGRYTYVSAIVPGTLKTLSVTRGTAVERGQLLLTLDPQPESHRYQAAEDTLRQATASRDAIAANLDYAERTWHRYQKLVLKHAASEADLDKAHSSWLSTQKDLDAATAQIASLEQTLAESSWTLQQKTLSAPVSGQVFDTYYRTGEYVALNQPILSLLAPENIKAIFYVSETDLAEIRTGNAISVSCDQCQEPANGTVRFISPTAEYTPPVMYSSDMRTKMIYRVEADFPNAVARTLHPGQPVTVTWKAS